MSLFGLFSGAFGKGTTAYNMKPDRVDQRFRRKDDYMAEYEKLDTQAFENFISSRESLISRYNSITTRYKQTVKTLIENWKGKGADAFEEDSEKVIANLGGIQDILITMCDTLRDCREIFGECDTSLRENNINVMN